MNNQTTFYNKLVRDKIPSIIREEGRVPNVRHLQHEEYLKCLANKLVEEAQEVCSAHESNGDTIGEIADLVEVLSVFMRELNIKTMQVQQVRSDKNNKKGSFDEKAFLISVENVNTTADSN